ncbi:MAG: hypothetical protein IJM37_01975 [Lachnospiraceae bacterium]|nr:hypothetical protein [Lachnospiraceae bacterium]
MKKIKRTRAFCALLAVLMMMSVVSVNASAFNGPNRKWATIDAASLKNVSGTRKAVQKAYIVNDNAIYAYQRLNDNDMVLTYCTRSGGAGSFKAQSCMILKGFGHAQSLDMDKYGYFWSTCNGVGGKYNFGNYVTRFKYQANKTVNYKKDLKYWTTSSKRVELAVTSDGDYLYVRLEDGTCSRYAVDDILKVSSGKALSSAAHVSALYVDCPEGSNQGLEYSNGFAVYIAGAESTGEKKWKNPKIWKKTSSGYVKREMESMPASYEVEGIQIKGSYLYVSVTAHKNPNEFYIYRIEKSLWD